MIAFIIRCQVKARVAVAGLPASQQEWFSSLSCVSCALSSSLLRFSTICSCTPLQECPIIHLSRQHRPMPDCLQAQVTKSGKSPLMSSILTKLHRDELQPAANCQIQQVMLRVNLHANFNDSSPGPSTPQLTNIRHGQASEPKMAAYLALHFRKVQWILL